MKTSRSDSAPLRIGCVPYLNAKPLIHWFDTPACQLEEVRAEVTYTVPSELARLLREARLDVALVSSVELFHHPDLVVIPDISISAEGPVKSVRLFSCRPYTRIERV